MTQVIRCLGAIECFEGDLRVHPCFVVEILCFGIEYIPLLRGQITTGHIFVQSLIAPQQCLLLRIVFDGFLHSGLAVTQLSTSVFRIIGIGTVAVFGVVTFGQQEVPTAAFTPTDHITCTQGSVEVHLYTDHQRRTGGLYGAADRAPAAARRGNGSDHGGVSEKDDAFSGQLGEGMSVGSEEPGETGWEREREIFASTLRADHAHEEAEQALLPDRYDPQLDPASLGTGAAYLAADLWELMDEDEPVEDCTTMPTHPERKKNQVPVMGGM